MKRAFWILAALVCLFGGAGQAMAGTLVGPTSFAVVGANDSLWGIQFTALDNSTLTGFDCNHNPTSFGNPFTGTIYVNDITTSTNLFTQDYTAGSSNPLVFAGLNVALTTGDAYQLVATSDIVSGGNDEAFQYVVGQYPISNSDISVTQGVFNNNPGFQESNAWGAFNYITTTSAVPEPGTFSLLGIGISGLIGYIRRRKRSQRTA